MRRQFKYKLLDGKEYLFTERNKEDIDFSHLQEAVRESVFDRIKKYESENRITREMADDLRLVNFQKVYNDLEVSTFIASHPDEIFKLVYASFKLNNENIPFEQFKKNINEQLAKKLLTQINEIERSGEPLTDEETAKALGINIREFKKIIKTQPEAYKWLKENVKKKETG